MDKAQGESNPSLACASKNQKNAKMIYFITDIRSGEPDILTHVKNENLTVYNLDKDLIKVVPCPSDGWTHELLMQESENLSPLTDPMGADAYLGSQWVGSTEC